MKRLTPLLLLLGAACLTDLEFGRGEGSFCDASKPCAPGFFCDDDQRLCVAVRPLAAACARDAECGSGFCATGVCCESACAGLCASCAVEGDAGSCVAVPAGEDPFGDCPGTTACDGERSCEGRPIWSRRFGLFGDQRATALATGGSAIGIAGTFQNAISFGTTTLTTTVQGDEDAFVAVLDEGGAPRWENALGGIGVETPRAIVVHEDGGATVVGHFRGVLRAGTVEAISDELDLFAVSYDAAGELRWLFAPPHPGDQRADGVAMEEDGYVVVGSSDGPIAIDDCTLAPSSVGAGVILHLDTEGGCRRGRVLGGTGAGQSLRAVAARRGALFVAGESAGAFGFGAIVVEGGTDRDAFVARLDGDDGVVWARLLRAAGDTGDDRVHALALDGVGRPWVVGQARDRIDGAAENPTTAGRGDAFAIALEAESPTIVEAVTLGDRYDDDALAVAADPAGGVILAGSFEASSPFGDGEAAGGSDGFVARLATATSLRWSLPLGGRVDDAVTAVASLPDGDLVLAGTFGRTITVGNEPLVAEGGTDLFVARLRP